jgi:hypothetical protein
MKNRFLYAIGSWVSLHYLNRYFFQVENNLLVLFRTRNLGQHFFDISKKNDVNQSLASLINDNY